MQHDDTANLLILLIDPNQDRSSSLSSDLSAAGFEVICASTWLEGQERLDDDLPELVAIAGCLFEAEHVSEANRFLESQGSVAIFAVLEEEEQVDLEGRVDEWMRLPFNALEWSERIRSGRKHKQSRLDLATASTGLDVLQRMGRMGAWKLMIESGELYCTEAACHLLSVEPGAEAKSADVLLASATNTNEAELRTWLEDLFSGQGETQIEYELEHDDGTHRRLRLRADMPIESANGSSISGVVQDCTPGLDPAESIELANINDPLTGLPNRKQFLQCLDRAITEAFETQEQIAILYVEVDSEACGLADFEKEQREALLVNVVQHLSSDLRAMDVLGQPGAEMSDVSLSRVGTESLTLLLRDQTRSQDAYKVGRRIREGAEATFVVEGRDIKVHFNIGIAVYPGDAESALGLTKCAEEAMYCAKQHGRNNIQFYTNSMNTATFESLTLEASLRRALEREELMVYYQPKVNISTNTVIGMEALVRWKHPELGMVSPAQFIPIAEETGLIIPIGEFVLRTACEQNKAWQDMGLPPIRMAVNLSSIQFRRPDLFDNVIGVLEDTRLDPEWLELEITESILLRNVEATISTLQRLKRAGIHMSIDDFGTGYSSLSYLKRFPVDTLKIDQSFIREVTSNADDASITTSIILMGHSLKLKVIAEGVETKSQLAFLRVLECDEVQGYFFSPPVPGDDAGKLIEGLFAKETA